MCQLSVDLIFASFLILVVNFFIYIQQRDRVYLARSK